MFGKEIYVGRRKRLLEEMRATGNDGRRGIAVFLGNVEAPQNYRGNDYKFRQESSFLYFWGIDEPGFGAILDLDSGDEVLYGNDVDIDDIIWMGPQPSVASKGGGRKRAEDGTGVREFRNHRISRTDESRDFHETHQGSL